MSRNKTNEIQGVYFRKRKVFINISTQINDFGGLEIQAVRIGGSLYKYLPLERKGMWQVSKGEWWAVLEKDNARSKL